MTGLFSMQCSSWGSEKDTVVAHNGGSRCMSIHLLTVTDGKSGNFGQILPRRQDRIMRAELMLENGLRFRPVSYEGDVKKNKTKQSNRQSKQHKQTCILQDLLTRLVLLFIHYQKYSTHRLNCRSRCQLALLAHALHWV